KPGVLAQITGILGDHGISIASVIQHDATDAADVGVPLVIMTHVCPSQAVQRAVAAIDAAGVTRAASTCLSVLDDWTPVT
ncbi:MAG: ACT domain-containing protein, partial [Planctomycetota bacterium]|nr:ACT domain-containing protein [Planctomycetota bacterium]